MQKKNQKLWCIIISIISFVDATTVYMVKFFIVLGCHLIASENLSPESKPVEILSKKI